jgi:hypothetical protein
MAGDLVIQTMRQNASAMPGRDEAGLFFLKRREKGG